MIVGSMVIKAKGQRGEAKIGGIDDLSLADHVLIDQESALETEEIGIVHIKIPGAERGLEVKNLIKSKIM
jgi:hypothetical protein